MNLKMILYILFNHSGQTKKVIMCRKSQTRKADSQYQVKNGQVIFGNEPKDYQKDHLYKRIGDGQETKKRIKKKQKRIKKKQKRTSFDLFLEPASKIIQAELKLSPEIWMRRRIQYLWKLIQDERYKENILNIFKNGRFKRLYLMSKVRCLKRKIEGATTHSKRLVKIILQSRSQNKRKQKEKKNRVQTLRAQYSSASSQGYLHPCNQLDGSNSIL